MQSHGPHTQTQLRRRYIYAALVCAATAALALPLRDRLDAANIVVIFLLAVVIVALRFGRGPAVLAAFLSVGLFDFLFVLPYYSLAVSDAQYLVTFAVMLIVGLITGQLTAGLRQAAVEAAARENSTRALYEMARELAGALKLEQVLETSQRFARETLESRIAVLLPDAEGRVHAPAGEDWVDGQAAALAYQSPACLDNDAGASALYLPLAAPSRVRGVLAISRSDGRIGPLSDQRHLLDAFASLIGIAVERMHYAEVAQRSQMQVASERLRSSLLSALSHDVRTPITALVGLADALVHGKSPLTGAQCEIAESIREQGMRINEMVSKLLDMARLSAGHVKLRGEWQPLKEVVGASLQLLGATLRDRPINVDLPQDLPLIEFDAVLIERVLCNLLENAHKYSPAQLPIGMGRRLRGEHALPAHLCRPPARKARARPGTPAAHRNRDWRRLSLQTLNRTHI